MNVISQQSNTIILLPLVKPGSTHPKSADSAWYMVRGLEANLRDRARPRRLILCKKAGDVGRKHAGPNKTLILLDDYIGSGDSALKTIDNLSSRYSNTHQMQIMILTLAAQGQAITLLGNRGIIVVAAHVLRRGISDNTSLLNVSSALAVMDVIGKNLCIPKKDRLGYGKTEALITLTRTPNNTFPIYWTNRKTKYGVWDPPFPRFTDHER